MIRANDKVRIRLDAGGTLTVTVDEILRPDRAAYTGWGGWAYDRHGSCYWLDTEDGHAYKGVDASHVRGHVGRFTV